MQAIIADVIGLCRHRLDALAVTRADQTGNASRTLLPLRHKSEFSQKSLKQASEIFGPVCVHHQLLQKLTPYETPKPPWGNPKIHNLPK